MSEKPLDTRTVVGVPFYEKEEPDVLNACLKNIDECLNNLGVDAKIVVGVNGPQTSSGQPTTYEINRSEFNADITFITTSPGIVEAERTIGQQAAEEGHEKIFLTDADISRFPNALHHMWNEGDSPVVGANYSAYPIEIVTGAGIEFSPQEIALMKIFEADKHPLAREFTFPYRPQKRLKGSLLLVDPKIIQHMFGAQNITSDSRMNCVLSETDKELVPNAAFMHFARFSITDHFQGRLRHFRAAHALDDLESFTNRSLIYNPDLANQIASNIVQRYPQATDVASNFLLQCALRHKVAEICATIASGEYYNSQVPSTHLDEIDLSEVSTFKEASDRIDGLLGQVDWEALQSPVTNGSGTTNNDKTRVPIDLNPFLESEQNKTIILNHLGLDENTVI